MFPVQWNGTGSLGLLVCVDDPFTRSPLENSVSAWGYSPIFAHDLPQAWEILARRDAPRLVLLNWEGHPQDGVDLCRRIKRSPGLPYVYILMLMPSRHAHQDLLSGLDAGADEILIKPIHMDELQKRLQVARGLIETMVKAGPPSELIIPGYEIKATLRNGSLGTVYRAQRLATGQEAAIKVIRMDRVSGRARSRFIREIELTSRLHHPNIVRIFDARLDIGIYYYAMELIHGPDLAIYVEKQNPGWFKLLRIMSQVCDGLACAHAHGIVHRDVKFANVLVNEHDVPKLVDFGLGKDLLDSDCEAQLSSDGLVVGTPAFMSPEQASFEPQKVGPQSDVYALGVMLYRLLLGQHPHTLKNPVRAMLKCIVEEDIRPPRELAPNLHPQLEAILLKALAKDPAVRYPHAGEMAEALRALLASMPGANLPPESQPLLLAKTGC